MASRYHWVVSSYDSALAGDGAAANLDNVIPAHATMKRFLIRGCSVAGRELGVNPEDIQSILWYANVDIVAGAYSPRSLFATRRRIPFVATASLHNVAALNAHYSQYISAGDNELAFNEKCSYGLSTGPGFTVRLSSGIIAVPATLAQPFVRIVCQFRTLYFL